MSNFFTQQWAVDPEYLLKMEEVVKRSFGLSKEQLSLYSNSEKNTPYSVEIEASYTDKELNTRKNGKKKKNVRVIPIRGGMFKKAGMIESVSGLASTSQMAAWVDEANAVGSSVDAILLDIDSPGGAVDGTETLGNAIVNSKIPVVAFVNGTAASAAYWVASQAKEVILSEQNAQVGSIGVIYTHTDYSGWLNKEGQKITHIVNDKASFKAKPSYDRELDEEDIAAVKERLQPAAENFEKAVRRGRGEVEEEAFNGKMFIAKKAIELNLANRVGTFADALQRAAFLSTQQPPNKMNDSAAVNALKEQFEARLQEKDSLIAALEEELEDGRKLKQENAKLVAENEDLKQKYANLEGANAELNGQLSALRKDLETTPETPALGVEVAKDIETGAQSSWAQQPWNIQKKEKLDRLKVIQKKRGQ